MADKSGTDIVMRFTYGDKGPPIGGPSKGDPVLAECALEVDLKDRFMAGFVPQDYDTYSNFFEVLNFSFNFGAKEGSEADEDPKFHRSTALTGMRLTGAPDAGTRPGAADNKVPGLVGPFAKWRSTKDPEWKKQGFGVDIESFSFSRLIDRASPTFFEWCTNSYTFQKAYLVKRRAVGLSHGSNAIPQGYLKFEFTNVMLKGVKWSDGDVVTEECEMLFEQFEVQYKRQSASGKLDASPYTSSAFWDREVHTNPAKKPRDA